LGEGCLLLRGREGKGMGKGKKGDGKEREGRGKGRGRTTSIPHFFRPCPFCPWTPLGAPSPVPPTIQKKSPPLIFTSTIIITEFKLTYSEKKSNTISDGVTLSWA